MMACCYSIEVDCYLCYMPSHGRAEMLISNTPPAAKSYIAPPEAVAVASIDLLPVYPALKPP